MKTIISIFLTIFLFNISVAKDTFRDHDLITKKADRIFYPGDPVNASHIILPNPNRNRPQRDDFIGERFLAGRTFYDYQTNGSVGKMIALDSENGIHITWMDGEDADMANGTRNMKYNFFNPEDDSWIEEDGVPIQTGTRGGYGCIALTNEESQRALAFYHHTAGGGAGNFSMVGVDWARGIGAFDNARLPNYPEDEVLWAQGVMSPEGRIHVVYRRRAGESMISYTRAILNDDGNPVALDENPTAIQLSHVNTTRIARSPNSERAAITWMRSRVDFMDIHDFADWDGFAAYQMNNDLMLAWTDDGEEWNFEQARNITQNIPPDPLQEGVGSYGDTLRAYSNHDVIFDSEDNIHVVFDARQLKVQANPAGDRPPIDGLTVDASYIFHWSEETDQVTAVADGWYSQAIFDDEGIFVRRPVPGAWRSNVCNPSLGYDSEGDLYCVYNIYPLEDYSERDRVNGDIAVTVSEDNGATWYEPTMVVQTNTHLAEDGEHECESYPTVAEIVDDFLHISYEVDTEPGTSIQDDNMPITLCPWYYQRVPVEEISRENIWEDPPSWHVGFIPTVADITRDPGVPIAEQDVTVTARVLANGGRALEEVTLEYVLDGDLENSQSIDMEETEVANVYSGIIPDVDEGISVWYRVTATDNDQGITTNPVGWWYSYMPRIEEGLLIRDIQYRPEEWTVDYSPYMDYGVSVSGTVTTNPEFAGNFGAFAIQEDSELWSGVFVRGADEFPEEGSLVQVIGVVRESDDNDNSGRWRYLTYIDVSEGGSIEVLGQGDIPAPIEIEVSDMVMDTRAEHLEGVLAHLNAFEIGSLDDVDLLGDYYPIVSLDDEAEGWMITYGLDAAVQEDLGFLDYRQGTRLPYLTGIFTENQNYGIAPRTDEDVPPFDQVSVREEQKVLPYSVKLNAAYPNPFNSKTRISFDIPEAARVNLAVYTLNGRLIDNIIQGQVSVGNNALNYDASGLTTGMYILRLETTGITLNQKLVLVK